MYNLPLSPYQVHKQQAKGILNRIQTHQFQQLQRQRSEGFYIAEDLKEELRKVYKKTKTENTLNHSRQRQISLHFQTCHIEEKEFRRRLSCPRVRRSLLKEGISQVERRMSRETTIRAKRESKIQQKQLDQVLNQVDVHMKGESQSSDSGSDENELQQTSNRQKSRPNLQGLLQNYKQNKTFLPMLQLYVQQRIFLKNMSQKQERAHSLINQMLLLALARRKNKKLLDALDILIQIDAFFPRNSSQLDLLRSVWYQLIAKLFMQIKQGEKKKQKDNRWRNGRSSISGAFQRKRQKTLMIQSLSSRRNLMCRVSVQLERMKLVYESSYLRELRDGINMVEETQKGKIVIRMGQHYLVSFPQPALLFPQKEQELTNYGIVMVSRDKESNLFPHHYPSSISEVIYSQEYTNAFCKINSILIPQRKCINFQSSMHRNYETIFLICFVFLSSIIAMIVFSQYYVSREVKVLLAVLVMLVVGGLTMRINGGSKAVVGRSNQLYLAVSKILQEWTQTYSQGTVKFTLSEQVDMIMISFPIADEEQEMSSIDERGSHRLSGRFSSKKISMILSSSNKLFAEMSDLIQKEEDQSDQTEVQQLKRQLSQIVSQSQDNSSQSSDEIDQREDENVIRVRPKEEPQVIFEVEEEDESQMQV